jgi:tetratricopeptide (TPR) repeat protein
MLKTRIILVVVSAALIAVIFMLPKIVLDNEPKLNTADKDSTSAPKQDMHNTAPEGTLSAIRSVRAQLSGGVTNEKNAIFADSLVKLYSDAGKFDSAAWFAEEASKFFNTPKSWTKTGDAYYQAYTFALDQTKQNAMAGKAQEYYQKVLGADRRNLEVKTKLAMTYITSPSPMRGISLLREVISEDPDNELALFNLGMLSIQSGQNDKAVGHLEKLITVNPNHTQGHLLLGIAWMREGKNQKAKEQFEKVKQMDNDPAVHATVDSYLKDLK